MYLAPLKGLIVAALRDTLTADYPVEGLREIRASIEYPIAEAEFPAIWVDYDDTEPLRKAGVDHTEIIEVPSEDIEDAFVEVTRWRFEGYVTLTVVALSSFERDLAYDEIVGMIAFGSEDHARGTFRRIIEHNDFLAVTMDTDTIQPRGAVAAAGTPWGTDEIVYERTINLNVIGEFIPDPEDPKELLRLSEIIIKPYNMADPADVAALEASQAGTGGQGPTVWH